MCISDGFAVVFVGAGAVTSRDPSQSEHEPGMGGSLANAAIRDDIVAFLETLLLLVDGAQGSGILEASIRIRSARPGNAARSLDVTATQSSFLRVVGHVGALPRVFLR